MSRPGPTLREAVLPHDTPALQALIREYVAWLDIDLTYRGFEAEMAGFEALFTWPSGLFLLACEGDTLAGCVGLLRHDAATAEVKRLYVRPAFRGQAVGERLMTALRHKAVSLGVQRLILDAVPPTQAAQVLYRRLGFAEIAPYYPNPLPGTRFFSLSLDTGTPCLS
jgi:carbonic anhydrase